MKILKNSLPDEKEPRKASTLEAIGGEPLAGSGFENEKPETEFSENDQNPE